MQKKAYTCGEDGCFPPHRRVCSMLLTGYTRETRQAAACKPGKPPLCCSARLNDDISAVLPYLNAVLKGTGFNREPPAMLVEDRGRQIAISGQQITISPVADDGEAAAVLARLQQLINETWEKRQQIEPCYEASAAPKVMDILRLLPQTNCGRCGCSTCTVFASQLAQGAAAPDHCPFLGPEEMAWLTAYLRRFERSVPPLF